MAQSGISGNIRHVATPTPPDPQHRQDQPEPKQSSVLKTAARSHNSDYEAMLEARDQINMGPRR